MSVEMDELRYRFRRIKAIELLNLPTTSDTRYYRLKIFAGSVSKKTDAYALKKNSLKTASIPKWTIGLDLSHINESEMFQVDVYCRRGKGEYQCLGFCGASVRDVLIGDSDIIVMSIGSNSPHPNVSLKIFREGATDYPSIAQSENQDQGMSTAPQSGLPGSQHTSELSGLQLEAISTTSVQDHWATAGKVVEAIPKPKEPSEWVSTLIDGVDTVEGMIDVLKDVHPAASIAWGIISFGFNAMKKQTERDKTVLRLFEAMITTYKEASDDRLLWQREQLEPIYKSLFQTTNECGMFIKRYTNKNRYKRFFSLNVSQKAKEFIQGFANLREQLDSGVAKDTLAVTLGVEVRVDKLDIQMALQRLQPKQELGPKSVCMPGTRVETINALISWIAEYDKGVLWCSGLAGTGKSSVVGTLHDLLCSHMSSRSRLAAFIRYDRTEYRDSSELITSIAYSMGMFDQRIGDAIAKALSVSRAAVKTTASKSRTQFRLLLQEPLKTVRELQDEGPLVVVIDGLDESDVPKDLLEVLADGFGPTLPFIRLVISSRPEEKISHVFKKSQHVHSFPLDTSSPEVKHDIRHFIRQMFASIKDNKVWGPYNKEDIVTRLAERASGLFIWAATVCSFLCDFPSFQRLKALLETVIPADAMEALTILYRTALDTIVSEVYGTKEDVRRCILAVLGALMVRKGDMTVPILPELVLQEGDPSAQLIIDKLGSVVAQERSGNLALIHKSFDDFLQDHDRCGDRWFIDVKEHEKELARRCMLSLINFAENWTPPPSGHAIEDQVQPTHSSSNSRNPTGKVWALYSAVPFHIGYYALNVIEWHIDALLELGIITCHWFFEHHFLSLLKVFYACSTDRSNDLIHKALLKAISWVNAEVTDQSLHTYVYHAFAFWERTYDFVNRTGRDNDPEKLVYDIAMSLSPSTNFICRDWGRSSRIRTIFDKERLLALTPWTSEESCRCKNLYILRGPQYIQYERLEHHRFPHSLVSFAEIEFRFRSNGPVLAHSEGSVLFDVDTGQIAEQPFQPILQCFPNAPLAPSSTCISYQAIHPSAQIVRFVLLKKHENEGFEFSDSLRYEVIDRQGSGRHNAMGYDVFISILNTQTSCCEDYLFLGWYFHVVVQYLHGLFIVDPLSGAIHGTQTGRKKWIILDGWIDNAYVDPVVLTITEDGSRLLGLTIETSNLRSRIPTLREWETSTGTLLSTYRFQYSITSIEDIQISPDASKVAVGGLGIQFKPAFITPTPSRGGIRDPIEVGDVKCLTWFPDSDRIAYLRRQCEHQRCHYCCDLVVQRLTSGQSTTINRWCGRAVLNILVTADGSRVITQDEESFRTWDVSDL